jgi:hypothetical protein
MPKYLGDVRCWVNSGKHMLAWSFSDFDPIATLTATSVELPMLVFAPIKVIKRSIEMQ